jgi:hypothetical protein
MSMKKCTNYINILTRHITLTQALTHHSALAFVPTYQIGHREAEVYTFTASQNDGNL